MIKNVLNLLTLSSNNKFVTEVSIFFSITVILLLLILALLLILLMLRTHKSWRNFNKKSHMSTISSSEKRMLSSIVSEAVIKLSEQKIGALITIERNVPLTQYIELGVKIDSEISSQLLQSIFFKGSPLHDGSVIIRLGRVECASAYFPLTNKKISSQFGSRHRAALGISEVSDAISVIVSETNGSVSIAKEGKFIQIENLNNLLRILYDELASNKEIKNQK